MIGNEADYNNGRWGFGYITESIDAIQDNVNCDGEKTDKYEIGHWGKYNIYLKDGNIIPMSNTRSMEYFMYQYFVRV